MMFFTYSICLDLVEITIMNLYIFLIMNCALGANILYISPIPSRSHHMWNSALAIGLNKKGHNVTMLTREDEKSKPKNFHVIIMEGFYDKYKEDFSIESLSKFNYVTSIMNLYDISKVTCEHDFSTNGLSILMKYPKDFKFDLIVFDVTFSQCLYPIIDRFNNPPVVGVTPFLLPTALSHVFGNPLQTSYMPIYSTPYTNRMTFKERLINFLLIYAEVLYRRYVALPIEYEIAKQYFGGHVRALEDIERNISILLTNTDPILENPIDVPPNIIPVGGLHTHVVKPLPEDLQRIVNNSKNGFIVFSMGTFIKSSQISVPKRSAILNAFGKLSQTVFWKFENDDIEDLPKNVVVRKWLPQSDLLAQPNAKLLISHGGGLSTQEAMYHGVPVVAIPIFADQIANAGRLENKKMAKTIEYQSITEDIIYATVSEVLNNPTYRNNIQSLSKRFRDKLNTPLETAIFWTEYVLRHGGAEHLNLPSRDMPFFQTLSLDIFVVLMLAVYLIYSVICLLVTILKATINCMNVSYKSMFV